MLLICWPPADLSLQNMKFVTWSHCVNSQDSYSHNLNCTQQTRLLSSPRGKHLNVTWHQCAKGVCVVP